MEGVGSIATLEKKIIGGALLDENARNLFLTLEDDLFVTPILKLLATKLKEYFQQGITDMTAISDKLTMQLNGQAQDAILELVDASSFAPTYDEFAQSVSRLRHRHKRLEVAKILQESYKDVVSDNIKEARRKLEKIIFEETAEMKPADLKTFDKFEYRVVRTGYPNIDDKIGGLFCGEITTFAARPGHGKTTFGIALANKIALSGKRVVFFSVEMSAQSVIAKIASSIAKVPYRQILIGYDYTPEEYWDVAAHMEELDGRLFVFDSIRSATDMIQIAIGYRADVVIIDFLQQMEYPLADARISIWRIMNTLKTFAKEYDIPVVLFSQVNREHERRQGNDFEMSDLSESAAIEWFSATIGFLYWPYLKNGIESERNILKLIIKKARFGGIGQISLRYVPEYSIIE